MSQCVGFGELRFVDMLMCYTIDTYPEFQWDFALSFEIAHSLQMAALLDLPFLIKADDTQAYVSVRIQKYFRRGVKLVTAVSYSPAGQAIIKRFNIHTLL